MKKMKFPKKFFKYSLCLLVAFASASFLKGLLQDSDQRVLPPPEGMEYYSFGFGETLSDLLWLNFIQNSYECTQKKVCVQDWGYRTLKQASTLAPKFKSLYRLGASNLSILADDDEGAKEIFDRGLAQYPDDWEINYRAGYHYLIELDQPERAAVLFDRAAQFGAPIWTRSLSANLYSRVGQLETSERILKDMLGYQMGPEWDRALKVRLEEVQTQLRTQRLQNSVKEHHSSSSPLINSN